MIVAIAELVRREPEEVVVPMTRAELEVGGRERRLRIGRVADDEVLVSTVHHHGVEAQEPPSPRGRDRALDDRAVVGRELFLADLQRRHGRRAVHLQVDPGRDAGIVTAAPEQHDDQSELDPSTHDAFGYHARPPSCIMRASVNAFIANGVTVSDLASVAGAGVNGTTGSMRFITEVGPQNSNRMVYFTESLGTFGTGYLLPSFPR